MSELASEWVDVPNFFLCCLLIAIKGVCYETIYQFLGDRQDLKRAADECCRITAIEPYYFFFVVRLWNVFKINA